MLYELKTLGFTVSTHSRLKAAGNGKPVQITITFGFNTQPPEGGWQKMQILRTVGAGFNTQPPEGGWVISIIKYPAPSVSTHSRLKAAGKFELHIVVGIVVSTHSRLKAAGRRRGRSSLMIGRFNTQPPEGGWDDCKWYEDTRKWFQHTAA